MIWLLAASSLALECYLEPNSIQSGTIEDGFDVFFSNYEAQLEQMHPHWNDNILRMSVLVEGAEEESVSVRWESSLSGVLQESDSTKHMQLWAPNLRTGTHTITVTVQDKEGEKCSASLPVTVAIPPLNCLFVEEHRFGIVGDIQDDGGDVQSEEMENPFPFERTLYPLVQGRVHKDIRVWVEDEENRYSVSMDRNGNGKLVLPPRQDTHTLNLVAQADSGRQCTSQIRFLEANSPEYQSEHSNTNLGRELMVSTGFGLSHHSGWGGEGILSPAFDLIFAGNISDGYFWGGDLAIDFREAYRKYTLKAQVGALNGFAIGPFMLLTGGGLGYDEYAQINSDLSETRLHEENHLYSYWRNELFIWFDDDKALSGGFIPRWHWSDAVSAPQFWDTYSWNTTLRYSNLMLSYEQHVVNDDVIHSIMFGTGVTIFD